jgi:multidrug efflux system membrane fusion protein
MNAPDPQRDSRTLSGDGPLGRTPRHRRAWLWWTLGVVLVVIVIGAIVWLVRERAASAAAKSARNASGAAMPVGVAVAKTADVNVFLDGLGSVVPRATVTVHAQVNGQLIRVLYKEGQLVKKGDLLAEIDPRPYEATLEQAQGQYQRDQALLSAARVDLERYRTLVAEDSIAKQTLDTQAALVKQDEGTVKSDQGTVDMARVNLAYTRLTAPVAGRVGLRQVDPGNLVQSSDANGVVVITQLQPIDVEFTIPQDSIPSVVRPMQKGQILPVDALDRDRKNKLGSGSLLTMDNQIDVTTGTVKLKATFSNDDLALFPNQFVNAHMLIDTVKGATVIPSAAIQRGTQGTYAYVVNADNTVSVRKVTLGVTEGDMVAIVSGVAVGETFVIDGADKLREQAKVEPVVRGAPGASPAAIGAPAAAAQQKGGHRQKGGASAAGEKAPVAPSAALPPSPAGPATPPSSPTPAGTAKSAN